MAILSNLYTKSKNYNYNYNSLSLSGIVPVKGYYQTTLTGTRFVKGEKPETPRVVIMWPRSKCGVTKNYQLTLQGIQTVKNIEAHHAPTLKLIDTKTMGVKKAPAMEIVAPLTTVAITTEQKDESGDSESNEDDEDPEHSAALARLMAQLEHELDLTEELEEEEAEQEEQIDWAEDTKGFDATMRPLAFHGLGGDDLTEVNDKFETTKANFLKMIGTVEANKPNVLKPVIGGELIEAPLASNTNNDFNKHPCAITAGATGIYGKGHTTLNLFLDGVQNNKELTLNWVRTAYPTLKNDKVDIRQDDTIYKFKGKVDGNNKYDKLGLVEDFTGVLDDTHHISRGEETTTAEALRTLKNSGNEEDFIEYNYQKKRLSAVALGEFKSPINVVNYIPNSSSIIPLDFDKLDKVDPDELMRLKNILGSTPEIVFCFTSISGAGLKAGLCVGPIKDDARYKQCFAYAKEWVKSIDSGLIMDGSGSDVRRLIFTVSA